MENARKAPTIAPKPFTPLTFTPLGDMIAVGAQIGEQHVAILRSWAEQHELDPSLGGAARSMLDAVRSKITVKGELMPTYRGKRGPQLKYTTRRHIFWLTSEHLEALHAFGLLIGEQTQAGALRRLIEMAATDLAA